MTSDLLPLGVVVGGSLLSMIYYGVSARGRTDPHERPDRGGFVLGNFARNWFFWLVRPMERLSLALGLSPTALNLGGAFLGVGAGLCFATGRLPAGGWLVLLGGVSDVLDGRIARIRGLDNKAGAFLDSTLDRFSEVGAFVGLAVLFRDSAMEAAIVALALGGSLLVSYTRARGEGLGVVASVGVMQRAERLLVIGFGAILDPLVATRMGWADGTLLLALLGVVAVGTFGTAIYRSVWVARRLR